jgi:hypothetical protein
MNWRRGLFLAGIYLAAALPLILMMEAYDARSVKAAMKILSNRGEKSFQ